jgi:hypothetical protein
MQILSSSYENLLTEFLASRFKGVVSMPRMKAEAHLFLFLAGFHSDSNMKLGAHMEAFTPFRMTLILQWWIIVEGLAKKYVHGRLEPLFWLRVPELKVVIILWILRWPISHFEIL